MKLATREAGAEADSAGGAPVTVVVRRLVRPGAEGAFEAAMQEFIRFALAFPGNRGIHVVRPDGSSRHYTVVDRFADRAARRDFKEAPEYRQWMRRLGELTDGEPYMEELGGLAGWFAPPLGPRVAPPARIKMALVTFVGVYPLTSLLPQFFTRLLPGWHPLLVNVVTTAAIVAALTWLVMPLLIRALSPWLFRAIGPADRERA